MEPTPMASSRRGAPAHLARVSQHLPSPSGVSKDCRERRAIRAARRSRPRTTARAPDPGRLSALVALAAPGEEFLRASSALCNAFPRPPEGVARLMHLVDEQDGPPPACLQRLLRKT